MKTLIISLSLLVATHILADELSWVDEQVQAIKPARSGMSSRSLSHIKNPFIFLAKNGGGSSEKKATTTKAKPKDSSKTAKVASKVLSLAAIMNNAAMISGSWYKIGDSINGYKVREITSDSVLLTKNKKKLLLSTKSTRKNLKFQR